MKFDVYKKYTDISSDSENISIDVTKMFVF